MISDARYSDMKERIPHVKELFQTRHYTQCATQCERLLLTRAQDEIHPIHRAYLNFYLALSHDTMAREASMRHRAAELDLAEKHYLEAIAALDQRRPQQAHDVQQFSPTSSTSEDQPHGNGRRASDAVSLDSEQSLASSATSYADDEDEPTPKASGFKNHLSSHHDSDGSSATSNLLKKRPNPIVTSTPQRSLSPVRERFSADLSSFIRMVESHLASVRMLKESSAVLPGRYSSLSRPSTASSRPISRESSANHESDMDRLRDSRKSMNFRPRFDPTSVRNLCSEALSEL
ncbi:hypothetical protein BS50DRAFT_112424 [Corynespora cassiicola Philippines]|uniref:Uncharacterized protein n=1 Tax=Corynespora cassiicola Philippines TaxID=1448308 RepID=A0A2T2NDA1_CORCC|nr:hypothetical protein BS50DRAFT_112424 [Corynespora cassiicola Philippines]